jgi:hypothetical protein
MTSTSSIYRWRPWAGLGAASEPSDHQQSKSYIFLYVYKCQQVIGANHTTPMATVCEADHCLKEENAEKGMKDTLGWLEG